MRTLILAGSFREAATYARGKELRHYRFASSADAVSSFQAQRVVELPGFAGRLDKHALTAVANRVVRRGGEWVQDEYVPPAPPEPTLAEKAKVADYLMGDVPAGEAFAELEAASTPRVNAAETPEPLENKGSGRPQDKVPSATKPRRQRKPRVVNRPADDPFEA